jgi:hypothetical protein
MDAISVINVTIYDLLLNCYLTVTTASLIGSSGRPSRSISAIDSEDSEIVSRAIRRTGRRGSSH